MMGAYDGNDMERVDGFEPPTSCVCFAVASPQKLVTYPLDFFAKLGKRSNRVELHPLSDVRSILYRHYSNRSRSYKKNRRELR